MGSGLFVLWLIKGLPSVFTLAGVRISVLNTVAAHMEVAQIDCNPFLEPPKRELSMPDELSIRLFFQLNQRLDVKTTSIVIH